MHSLLLTFVLWLVAASPTLAQSRWVLIPARVGELEGPVAAPLETAVASANLPLLPNERAAVVLESEHSTDGEVIGPEEVARLDKLIGEGARELAANHRLEGQELFDRLEREPAEVLDYLRRAPERAQLLIDACVTASWLEHQENGAEAAKSLLRRCALTFPGQKPRSIPKKMRPIFEAVLQELDDTPHGRLEVDSRAGGKCLVRLNGTPLGRTPLHVEVPLGPARIQVECDQQPGRIHAVTVGAAHTRVVVDTEFDRAVRTHAGLSLTFAADTTTAQLAQLAKTLGQLLHAQVVLLLPAKPGAVRLLTPSQDLGTFPSVRAAQAPLLAALQASTPRPPPPPPRPSPKRLIAAVRAPEASTPSPASPPSRPRHAASLWPTIAAGTAVAAGIGGITASWVYYARRLTMRTGWDTLSYRDREVVQTARTMSLAFGLGGNVLLAAAEYVLLPRAQPQSIPLLAWAVGGGGAVLALTGAISAFTQRDCSLPSAVCTGFGNDPLFGELLLLHALPLLSVPLNYWLRGVFNPPVRVELGMNSPSQPIVQLRGQF